MYIYICTSYTYTVCYIIYTSYIGFTNTVFVKMMSKSQRNPGPSLTATEDEHGTLTVRSMARRLRMGDFAIPYAPCMIYLPTKLGHLSKEV